MNKPIELIQPASHEYWTGGHRGGFHVSGQRAIVSMAGIMWSSPIPENKWQEDFFNSAIERTETKPNKPKIVCLCGSTRFYKEFQQANYEETMKGNVVLSVGFYPHSSKQAHGENIGITPEQKIALDELHKRKIDLADEILVLNINGYIGDSTRSEIEYAQLHGKSIRMKEVFK